jgi:hypothetical protein
MEQAGYSVPRHRQAGKQEPLSAGAFFRSSDSVRRGRAGGVSGFFPRPAVAARFFSGPLLTFRSLVMNLAEPLPLALEIKAPWQMTLAEFAKAYKPIRCFQRYTSEQRARRPDRVYPSAGEACRITHWALIEQALMQGLPVPAEVWSDHPMLLWRENPTGSLARRAFTPETQTP